MTYGHLQADCLYTGISSGPNARCRVWEAFTFYLDTFCYLTVQTAPCYVQSFWHNIGVWLTDGQRGGIAVASTALAKRALRRAVKMACFFVNSEQYLLNPATLGISVSSPNSEDLSSYDIRPRSALMLNLFFCCYRLCKVCILFVHQCFVSMTLRSRSELWKYVLFTHWLQVRAFSPITLHLHFDVCFLFASLPLILSYPSPLFPSFLSHLLLIPPAAESCTLFLSRFGRLLNRLTCELSISACVCVRFYCSPVHTLSTLEWFCYGCLR